MMLLTPAISFAAARGEPDCRKKAYFFKLMYLLNTEPLASLSCPLNAVFSVLRGTVVTENGHLFHTNRRSGRARESIPSHLRGRQRRKALSHPLRFAKESFNFMAARRRNDFLYLNV
jgi:hypothetical protein